ncbi:MAG: hypothetical protein ACYCOR_11180, partial [Acidobacteriaceae bacterium]
MMKNTKRTLISASTGFALLAVAMGAAAVGAVAVGAVAVGAFAIGKLGIRQGRIEKLEIGELTLDRLIIQERTTEGIPNRRIAGCPIQAFFWLEWGRKSSTLGQSFSAARSRRLRLSCFRYQLR